MVSPIPNAELKYDGIEKPDVVGNDQRPAADALLGAGTFIVDLLAKRQEARKCRRDFDKIEKRIFKGSSFGLLSPICLFPFL